MKNRRKSHQHKHQHGPHGVDGPGSEFDHRGGRGHHGPQRGRGPSRRKGGGGRGPRVSRGEVRTGVLAILNDQPMHGYQIMQEMEERSGGAWQPSPGSIYPTLQQLADEGLVISEAVDGKNVFSLTEDGAGMVRDNQDPPPWEKFGGAGDIAFGNLRRSVHQLGAAARQVASAGTPSQVEAANKILTDARKSMYRLLAEDDADL